MLPSSWLFPIVGALCFTELERETDSMKFSTITTRIILVSVLGFALVLPAQASVILNTLDGYKANDPGWSGNLNGIFSGSGGNTERIAFSTGGRVQWQGAKHRYRLQATGGYQENDGVETEREVVVHLRHNRELGGRWSTVSFVQVQHNPFQRLKSRWLLGFGPRYDFKRDDQGLVAVGLTPMLEIEKLEDESGRLSRGRLSMFLHVARRLSANTKLDMVAFWQPLFSDASISRTVANLTLTVEITGTVDLKIGGAMEDNARPPAGVDRLDWSTFTGLGVSF